MQKIYKFSSCLVTSVLTNRRRSHSPYGGLTLSVRKNEVRMDRTSNNSYGLTPIAGCLTILNLIEKMALNDGIL